MNSQRDLNGSEMIDAELEQTLNDFRASVHAWSEAAYSQPHVPVKVYRTSWRVVAGWALGCVLAVGSLSGGLFERHRLTEQAKVAAAAEEARQQKMEAEQRRQTEELAKIDADVSRDVPSATEPLAQLMMEDTAQ